MLIIAGDVESNPGPIDGEKMHLTLIIFNKTIISPHADELLAQVDDSELSKFTCAVFLHMLLKLTS